ncbi:uncharacterized protein LY79DRAFT_324656 [Colletotrichum navitas]|uniref:Uncharacterized protein n=1 Tax=Colletotrichum navitas TaxID=681940 RepID=A0AAD8VB19_9PEZI|nr:uncharacterized protein LY79DRAFT_324656 [Colletotrichum navitas]KAK1597980.1 hypothetical protein LY79DRAFT_324656 [Colletotrichum navitas]
MLPEYSNNGSSVSWSPVLPMAAVLFHIRSSQALRVCAAEKRHHVSGAQRLFSKLAKPNRVTTAATVFLPSSLSTRDFSDRTLYANGRTAGVSNRHPPPPPFPPPLLRQLSAEPSNQRESSGHLFASYCAHGRERSSKTFFFSFLFRSFLFFFRCRFEGCRLEREGERENKLFQ